MYSTLMNKATFKKLAITVALLMAFINIALYAFHQGFYRAENTISEISHSGGSVFFDLAQLYIRVTLLLFIYLIGKIIRFEWLSQIMCIVSLIWVIKQFGKLYTLKSELLEIASPYLNLPLETIPFDWISFSFVLILLVYQIITAFQYLFYKNRNVLNTL